jgi:hypothetical protein
VFLTLGTGCSGGLPEYFGPLCDKAASGDWSPAAVRPELDHVDYAKWIDDPELEAQLLTYGMDDQWGHLSGSDVNQEGIESGKVILVDAERNHSRFLLPFDVRFDCGTPLRVTSDGRRWARLVDLTLTRRCEIK